MIKRSLKISFLIAWAYLSSSIGMLYAQVKLVPINFSRANQQSAARALMANDTIAMPLWDDFSAPSSQQPNGIWQNTEHIYINNGLAYLPPSYNVATLDGFDATGTAYSMESDEIGIGDSLVSKAINLSKFDASNNINLSFFWQEGFGPTAPDSNDSLRLYFKNNNNQWVFIRSFGGSGRSAPIKFQQAFASVDQSSYFHAGFQFKFEYFGNLAGDFDVWHLDYIYLNEGNNRVTTTDFRYDSYEDRTFSQISSSLFGQYYALPLKHLDSDFLTDVIQDGKLIYNNLWAGDGTTSIFGTEIFGSLYDTLQAYNIIDSITINGNFLTQAQDTASFSYQASDKNSIINYLLAQQATADSVYLALQFNLGNTDSLFFETINGVSTYYQQYSFKQNDTIRQIYPFHDYYALDDGSAEASIQLNSKNYEIAQYFEINGSHFITAVDLYIPKLAQNSSTQNITLLFLDNISEDNENVVYAENVLIGPSDQLNAFQRFQLSSPVAVDNGIYLGYREENDEVVSVGFDKNSNSAVDLYYNQSGVWQRNEILSGSMMIRPVFGELIDVLGNDKERVSKELIIYPNPSKGNFYLNQAYESLMIYGLDGKTYFHHKNEQDLDYSTPIEPPVLKDGLYIVQIVFRGQTKTTKLIIKH